MRRSLQVDSRSATPIWSQIEEGLRFLVASGGLVAGAAVPSVRDLARELRVNPATVSKAYQRLTDAGLLEVRRGDGTYVAVSPPAMAKAERQRALRDAALRFVGVAVTLGLSRREALTEVEGAWSEVEHRQKGREG
jgi:DNA-binding transcriptional regulator YhcF (GntR family)